MTPQQSNYAICIPTLNRIDLLIPSLLLYSIDFPETKIFVYDNGKQFIQSKLKAIRDLRGLYSCYKYTENVVILGGIGENIGVAGAWNALCDEAFIDHTHVLMLNDDVYLGKLQWDIQGLLNPLSLIGGFDFVTCEEAFDWSVFILPKRTFEQIRFDEKFFPAYYEDNDAEYRMRLAGLVNMWKIPFLNPAVFRRSMTLMKQPTLFNNYKDTNKEYYIKKWGGDVGQEKFETPFGQ